MVKYFHPQNLASFCQLFMDFQIAVAWFNLTGWMIVSENYTGSPVRYHIGKNFTGMHLTFIQQPNGYDPIFDNLVGAVRDMQIKCSCCLPAISLIRGNTSLAPVILMVSFTIYLLESSKPAKICDAFAMPDTLYFRELLHGQFAFIFGQ